MNTRDQTTITPAEAGEASGKGNGNHGSDHDSQFKPRTGESGHQAGHPVETSDHLHNERAFMQSLLERLPAIAEIRERLRNLEESSRCARQQLEPLLERTRQIIERQEQEAHNTEQLRLQFEQTSRKTEELSGNHIERNVEDPLCREILRFTTRLSQITGSGPDEQMKEISVLAAEMVRFLEERGLTLIWPREGDLFDPRVHRPIETVETNDETRVRHLARVHHPGLQRKGRVVEPALVAIHVPMNAAERM